MTEENKADRPLNPATELINKFYDGLMSLDDLSKLPPPTWLIDGHVMEGSTAVIWGEPGSGKSFVALDWALSVATGRRWFNHGVRQGAVLYVPGEGLRGIYKRANAWIGQHKLLPDNELFRTLSFMPDLFDHDQVETLAQVVAEFDVSFVVIDTLARAMVGRNENDNAEMGKFVQAAEKIRDARAAYGESVTVLLVHHSTKAPRGLQSMRGASSLRGGIDTEIELQKMDPEPDSPNTMRELICHKQKDAAPFKSSNVFMWERFDSLIPMPENDLGRYAI